MVVGPLKAKGTEMLGPVRFDENGLVPDEFPGWVEPVAVKAEKVPFDRAAHCKRIGQSGGLVTAERYGSSHMRQIGRVGYAVTAQVHGAARAQEIIRGKGWKSSRVSTFAEDMTGVPF